MKLLESYELFARKISVRMRLIIIFTLLLAAVTGAMGYYATSVMSSKIQTTAEQSLQAQLALSKAIIDLNYPGNWKVVDGKLRKGDVTIDDNFAVVDSIGKMTGSNVTIFRGDTRVSTNVMKDNKRAVGTQAAAEVIQTVLKDGKSFVSRVQVANVDNYTCYEPVKDEAGKIVGMVFVGVPCAPYDTLVNNFRTSMYAYSGIAVVLGLLFAFLIAYTVYKPLERLNVAVEKVSDGDLSYKIPHKAKDEPGQLADNVNVMIDKISGLVSKTKSLTSNVSESSVNLAKRCEMSTGLMEDMTMKAMEMRETASQQAQLSERSRMGMSEMSQAIKQVAGSAEEVLNSAMTATSKAREGENQIERAIEQMNVISRTVNSSSKLVEGLGAKSTAIGQIVDLIGGIANQTNLLALNAAIEAAHAGEQGKGFAVVAEEVRKLAEESGEAAQRIADLIKEIQLEADHSIKAMQDGTREVNHGTEVVSNAGHAFRKIIEAISLVSEQIQQMTAASEEMAASMESAVQSIQQATSKADDNSKASAAVSQLAQEQMAGIEEVTASVEYLNGIVAELEKAVAVFKI
ncbi:MAG: methyl-accepting chemotaxis protein [Syntrophomonadaceae bacterium]